MILACIFRLISLSLFFSIQFVEAFLSCPGGYKRCSSSDVPYWIVNQDNVLISNCIYVGCPQIVVTASNVTVRNCTFDALGVASKLDLAAGGAFHVYKDVNGLRPTTFNCQSVTFQNFYTTGYGSALFIGTPLTEPAVFTSCSFLYCHAEQDGGVFLNYGSDVTFLWCYFEGSSASDGGVLCSQRGFVSFIDCIMNWNRAYYGGVVNANNSPGLELIRCKFAGSSGNMGTSIYINYVSGRFLVSGCTFSGDSAKISGASFSVSGTNYFQVENTSFSDCAASSLGGTIYVSSTNQIFFKNVTILRSTAAEGGAILFQGSGNMTFDTCNFIQSSTTSSGGAISFRGQYVNTWVNMKNCIFSGNTAAMSGGAIYGYGCTIFFQNTTFLSNSADSGGAFHIIGPGNTVSLVNCLFSRNSAGTKGGSVTIDGLINLQVYDTIVMDSSSSSLGGGFYIAGALLNPAVMTRLLVLRSTAAANGGAFYFDTDTPFVLSDSTIQNSYATLGGCIYADGPTYSTAIVRNTTFTDQFASQQGGFAYFTTTFLLSFFNCLVTRSTAGGFGGVFVASLKSTLTIVNSTFINGTALDTGGFIYATGGANLQISDTTLNGISAGLNAPLIFASTSTINWQRINLLNMQTYLPFGGSYFDVQLSTVYLDRFTLNFGPSLLIMKLQSYVTIDLLTVMNSTATKNDQSLISCYKDSTLQLGPGSSVYGFQGSVILVLSSSSIAYVNGVSFTYNTLSSYGFLINGKSALNLNSTLIKGTQGTSGSTVFTEASSKVTCLNSELSGNSFYGCGVMYVGVEAYLNSTNCVIKDNYFTTRLNAVCNADSKILSGFAGAICNDGNVLLNYGVIITRNRANYAGAIYVGPTAQVTINSGVAITNNSATVMGGAFYLSGSVVNISSTGVTISGNTIISNGNNSDASSLAYFGGIDDGYFQLYSPSPGTVTTSVLQGGILVEYPSPAAQIVKSGLMTSFPGLIRWQGRASIIKVLNKDDFLAASNSLNLSQNILPPISVASYDYFGSPVTLIPENIVSVKLTEVSQNANLAGDVIKSILDESGIVSFEQVQIPERLPGSYVISIDPIPGSVRALPPDILLHMNMSSTNLLSVFYNECQKGFQLVSDLHDCFPESFLNESMRAGFAVCAGLVLLYSLYLFRQLELLKNDARMKKSVRNFKLLRIQVMGIAISMIALISQCYPNSALCSVYLWTENIGFLAIVLSLSLASYELFASGDEKYITLNVFHYLVGGFSVLMTLYLAIWTGLDSYRFQKYYYADQKVVVMDKCSSTRPFFIAIQAIKIAVALVSAGISLVIERKHRQESTMKYLESRIKSQVGHGNDKKETSDTSKLVSEVLQVEEPELLSLCSYNWVVFGPLISLIAAESISEPNIGFFFQMISVLVPNTLTLLILAVSRVVLCRMGKASAANKAVEDPAISQSVDHKSQQLSSNPTFK